MRFRRSKKRFQARRKALNTPKWRMKPRRSRVLKIKQLLKGRILICLAVIALIAGLVYVTFFTPLFEIQTVSVNTAYKDINPERIELSLEPAVVKQHALLISFSDIYSQIYEAFPDVSSLDCSRELWKRAVSCEAYGFELVAIIKHQNTKYYINENGVVIAYDARKLGLPFFDLILNPIFADRPEGQTEADLDPLAPEVEKDPQEQEEATDGLASTDTEEPGSLTASIIAERAEGTLIKPPEEEIPEEAKIPEEEGAADSGPPGERVVRFIAPTAEPPADPVIQNEGRKVFEVKLGKKILDPAEITTILEALQKLEKVLERKVINAQYVQVAGELSLTSRPAPPEPVAEQDPTAPVRAPEPSDESPDHEFTVLLDLRRDLEVQFLKLKKAKEVIDFSQVNQIDLSVDGEKVFYR